MNMPRTDWERTAALYSPMIWGTANPGHRSTQQAGKPQTAVRPGEPPDDEADASGAKRGDQDEHDENSRMIREVAGQTPGRGLMPHAKFAFPLSLRGLLGRVQGNPAELSGLSVGEPFAWR